MDNITIAPHAGFCFGVTKAVDTAYQELSKASAEGRSLYSLGQLIHNKAVTDELSANGLITAASIEDVPDGASAIIRAHGEPDITYEAASARNISLIDATCPFVKKIHDIVAKESHEGRTVIIIGAMSLR